MSASALLAFAIFAIIVIGVAYLIVYALDYIPGLPPGLINIAKLLVGLVALIVILQRALPLLGT